MEVWKSYCTTLNTTLTLRNLKIDWKHVELYDCARKRNDVIQISHRDIVNK